MKKAIRALAACGWVGVVAVALVWLVQAQEARGPDKNKAGASLSGPFTHDNLTIFLVHGEDKLKGKTFLTVPEALEQKKLVIHETQSVNELAMENLSAGDDILILSGDILKGGQQDRIAQYDMILPAKSGKVPLPAFCVERTAPRWMRPFQADDKADDKVFKESRDVLANNSLRLSARYQGGQGQVWQEVQKLQGQLAQNAGASVQAKESDSSLQLTLEAKAVCQAVDKYLAKLSPIMKDRSDVVGYVFAINGKVYCADVYGSPTIFQKVWPRLLKASATEAFAELQKEQRFDAVLLADVQAFLTDPVKATETSKEVTGRVRQVMQESKRNVLFESRDQAQHGLMIRRNIIAK